MPAVAKPDPIRRNARVGPVQLPMNGYAGPVPRWPLAPSSNVNVTTRERKIWRDLWRTPQAAEWHRLGWVHVVARYCRTLVGAEALDKDCMSEARQLEDRLGLTPRSMRTLLWVVARDEVADKRAERSGDESARERMRRVG